MGANNSLDTNLDDSIIKSMSNRLSPEKAKAITAEYWMIKRLICWVLGHKWKLPMYGKDGSGKRVWVCQNCERCLETQTQHY